MAGGVRLLVVVPTRNRAELAEQSIRSVLDADDRVNVLVSDNSTDAVQRDRLATFCAALIDQGFPLHYLQTPASLPMTRHWDWALERALEVEEASHFTFVTDRMLAKPKDFPALGRVCTLFQDDVVIFSEDWIADDTEPVRLLARRWSDKVLRVESDRLLERASRMRFHPLPRMMNCVVPRAVLTKILERFGTIFDSISPDFNFAFRCLTVCPSVVYFDRTVVALHAFYRSNGAAVTRGELGGDTADFLSMLDSDPNGKSPAPRVQTVSNGIVHEYVAVSETIPKPFPPLDVDAYYDRLRVEVAAVRNTARREQMEAYLARVRGPQLARPGAVERVLGLSDRIVSRSQGIWHAVARHLRLFPPAEGSLRFESSTAARSFLNLHPRQRHRLPFHLVLLLGRPLRVVGDSYTRTA